MPVESSFAPITIPLVDLWTFLFSRVDREYADNHVIYVDIAAQKKLTFQDIRTSAEQFGKGLLEHWEWKKGDVLALMTPNHIDVTAVTFGTLFAGGVVCPLNNQYTVDELVSQLKSSKAKALTTNLACLETACEAASIVGLGHDRILLVGDVDSKRRVQHFSSIRSTSSSVNQAIINPKEDLAFLVYSSGTTGLPKGVMLTHENIVANTLQNQAIGSADLLDWKEDRSLGFLPMYHIYGIAVLILTPLYRGITTFIMQKFDLKEFCEAIDREMITIAYIVPPVALALAKSPVIDKYSLRSLRMMHSSAATTAKDIIEGIYRRLGVPVKQGYGLSEASPGVAGQDLNNWNKPIGSSGRLGPSLSLKIVQDGKEVGHGEEGEILIKGPNIFKGYYNNPKATSEAIDAEGWYRTGDVGYVDKQENIYITDRVKELIKYNGFQVAPAQLEGLLLANPAVADVAVIGVYSEQRATELPRAYIVLASGYIRDEGMREKIHKWLNGQVAPYKRLRGGIRFVDSVPKSAAGKLLRRVLVEQAKQESLQEIVKARL